MSTRTNIVVKVGKTVTHVYRHCDGYPAVTGADLLDRALLAVGTPEHSRCDTDAAGEFLRGLLTSCYDARSFDPVPRNIYGLTNGLHGDIDHVYYVTFSQRRHGAHVWISHAERPRLTDGTDWQRGPTRYSLDAFRDVVNADRKAINARIALLKAQQPVAYADCEDYAMV